jgi:hypothetical protein
MKFLAAALTSLATFVVAPAAFAIDLDFTSLPPSVDGDSQWSTTVDGITVTVTPGPSGTRLDWTPEDGFGVEGPSYEDDEIEGNETLTVTFEDANGDPIDVIIDSFNVADLFHEAAATGPSYDEIGRYQVDGASPVAFTPSSGVVGHSNVNGTGTILVGAESSSVVLTAPGKVNAIYWTGTGWHKKKKVQEQNHEFALAGISFHVESVPELSASGAAGAFLVLGGLGLVLGGRRRRLANAVA